MAIWRSPHRLIVALSALVGLCFPACVDAQTGGSARGDSRSSTSTAVFTQNAWVQPPLPEDFEIIGGEPQALGLSNLIQIALERNPELRQARFQVGSAQGRALQAGLYPNPTVRVEGSELGHRDGPGGTIKAPGDCSSAAKSGSSSTINTYSSATESLLIVRLLV